MSFDVFLISVLVSPAMFQIITWSIALEFAGFRHSHLSPFAAKRLEMLSHGLSYTPETSCLPGCFHKLQYEDDLK